MISHHAALVYTMVLMSAADREMSDEELKVIGDVTMRLPIFRDYDIENLSGTAATCAELLETDNGLDTALELIKRALPDKLKETAYALACDVAAADGDAAQEELRLLELLRHELRIDRLNAAAIERGARARFMTL